MYKTIIFYHYGGKNYLSHEMRTYENRQNVIYNSYWTEMRASAYIRWYIKKN